MSSGGVRLLQLRGVYLTQSAIPFTWTILFAAGFLGYGILSIFSAIKGDWASAERRATLALAFLLCYWIAPV